jgi:heme exporter protein A
LLEYRLMYKNVVKDKFELIASDIACIRGEKLLFKKLSFKINNGILLEITGKNGAGKTSLLKILSALRLPDEGDVLFNNVYINKLKEDYYTFVSFLGHHNALKNNLSAYENLKISLALSTKQKGNIDEVLKKVELLPYKNEQVNTFSAGMKRRLSIAKLLLIDNPLWILDEPYTSVDLSGIKIIEGFFVEHLNNGGGIIMTSHHPLKIKNTYIQKLHIK